MVQPRVGDELVEVTPELVAVALEDSGPREGLALLGGLGRRGRRCSGWLYKGGRDGRMKLRPGKPENVRKSSNVLVFRRELWISQTKLWIRAFAYDHAQATRVGRRCRRAETVGYDRGR